MQTSMLQLLSLTHLVHITVQAQSEVPWDVFDTFETSLFACFLDFEGDILLKTLPEAFSLWLLLYIC